MTDVSYCSLALQQQFETYLDAARRFEATNAELDKRRRDDYRAIFEDQLLVWFKLIGYTTRHNVLCGLFTGAMYRNHSYTMLPLDAIDERDRPAFEYAKAHLP